MNIILCCGQTPSTVEQDIKDDVSNSLTPVRLRAISCPCNLPLRFVCCYGLPQPCDL